MYLGIDVGSVSTDAVLLGQDGKTKACCIVKSGFDHKKAIEEATNKVCCEAGITYNQIKSIVGTGYGRRNVPGASKTITEISCHAMGIHYIFPYARTVIDIGGQDSKVIRVSEKGFVETFLMNDKCAAGTGRFLEVMANAMGVEIFELGALALTAKKVEPISSICTVFAESEVISKIAEGCPREAIVSGIHHAIGERLIGMAASMGIKKPVALTGGVAKNSGVVKALTRHLGDSLLIPDDPQLVGALGAAIYAKNYDRANLKRETEYE